MKLRLLEILKIIADIGQYTDTKQYFLFIAQQLSLHSNEWALWFTMLIHLIRLVLTDIVFMRKVN